MMSGARKSQFSFITHHSSLRTVLNHPFHDLHFNQCARSDIALFGRHYDEAIGFGH